MVRVLIAVAMLLLCAPQAIAQTDAPLASWQHGGSQYTATLKDGALVVRQENAGTWSESGVALTDISCAYLAAKPVYDPHPTEVLLNFVTPGDPLLKLAPASAPRVWGRSEANPTQAYSGTHLDLTFDFADQSTALTLANKVIDATNGRLQECQT